jgi:hypothetical protein
MDHQAGTGLQRGGYALTEGVSKFSANDSECVNYSKKTE